MNISKFLLIDAALSFAVIPIIFWLQRKRTSPFQNQDKNELLNISKCKLPRKERLLEIEKHTNIEGDFIEFDSIFGAWEFIEVWTKQNDKRNSIFTSLLRIFSAKMLIKKNISSTAKLEFTIKISIEFGIFLIGFSGVGYLKRKEKLTPFYFNLIELKSGSNILLNRSLEEPLEINKSFFKLIAIGDDNRWLAARNQNEALVLWLKN